VPLPRWWAGGRLRVVSYEETFAAAVGRAATASSGPRDGSQTVDRSQVQWSGIRRYLTLSITVRTPSTSGSHGYSDLGRNHFCPGPAAAPAESVTEALRAVRARISVGRWMRPRWPSGRSMICFPVFAASMVFGRLGAPLALRLPVHTLWSTPERPLGTRSGEARPLSQQLRPFYHVIWISPGIAERWMPHW
jgi:hypothetical protein